MSEKIRSIFKEVSVEMRGRDMRVSRTNRSLTLHSWQDFADEFTDRGIDAEARRDGVMLDGGHLFADVGPNNSVDVGLILHGEGDMLNGTDTLGESFQCRKGKALMPHDAGAEGKSGTVACIEINGHRLCLSAEDASRLGDWLVGTPRNGSEQ